MDGSRAALILTVAALLLTVGYLPELLHRRHAGRLQDTPRGQRWAPDEPGASCWQRGVLGEPSRAVQPNPAREAALPLPYRPSDEDP
jgi:hypothetical protein